MPCRADRAEEAKALRAAQHLPVNGQTLFTVGVEEEPRRAVAVGGIDVLLPQVDGLEHVAVSVDNVVRPTHGYLNSPRDRAENRRGPNASYRSYRLSAG
jgi:hypothetical protein